MANFTDSYREARSDSHMRGVASKNLSAYLARFSFFLIRPQKPAIHTSFCCTLSAFLDMLISL